MVLKVRWYDPIVASKITAANIFIIKMTGGSTDIYYLGAGKDKCSVRKKLEIHLV